MPKRKHYSVSVGEFRKRFPTLLDRVADTRTPLLIKRGNRIVGVISKAAGPGTLKKELQHYRAIRSFMLLGMAWQGIEMGEEQQRLVELASAGQSGKSQEQE